MLTLVFSEVTADLSGQTEHRLTRTLCRRKLNFPRVKLGVNRLRGIPKNSSRAFIRGSLGRAAEAQRSVLQGVLNRSITLW